MKFTYKLFIACALLFALPAQSFASTAVINWSCNTFGAGCTNRIPATGTAGDMDPSTITVHPGKNGCEASIIDVDVYLNLLHTFRTDLEVRLTHEPTGTTVELFTNIGGGADDMHPTLTESALAEIGSAGNCDNADADCDGIYTPEGGSLNDFDNLNAIGTWRLNITDEFGGDIGDLQSWGLKFNFLDLDGDGTPDCWDQCPTEHNGFDDDGDGFSNCDDECDNDPNKSSSGQCGCGVVDADTDGDGFPDCFDGCSADALKTAPGICGCNVPDVDSDGDGNFDCVDSCPNDPAKLGAGECGCGVEDRDDNDNDIPDCNVGEELKYTSAEGLKAVKKLKPGKGARAKKKAVKAFAAQIADIVNGASVASVVAVAGADLTALGNTASTKMKKATRTSSSNAGKFKRQAKKALKQLTAGIV